MVVWGRGATTVLIATRYVPAIVSDTSNAFFRLSSPGSPVGLLTKEETETQKITYLAPEYRPEMQTQFYLVPNPSSEMNCYRSLPPGCEVVGCSKGYFLEAVQWGRIKLGLICKVGRGKRNSPVGAASHRDRPRHREQRSVLSTHCFRAPANDRVAEMVERTGAGGKGV